MYLLYLDDSGSAQNQNEEYLVLGWIAVFERQIHFINQEIDDLAASIHPPDPSIVEFHASSIFAGRTFPWSNMGKEDRRRSIRGILEILARSHDSVRAFACAVHKKSFPNRDPMYEAFEDICSRFDRLLKRIYTTQQEQQRGLIILDKSSYETSLQKLAGEFKTLGTRWGTIRNIVDVPMFVDSKPSRLVQLADHVAYAVYRRYESGDTSYLDPIIHKFDAEDGRIHGLVHKQHYNPNCMCPACMSRGLTEQG